MEPYGVSASIAATMDKAVKVRRHTAPHHITAIGVEGRAQGRDTDDEARSDLWRAFQSLHLVLLWWPAIVPVCAIEQHRHYGDTTGYINSTDAGISSSSGYAR